MSTTATSADARPTETSSAPGDPRSARPHEHGWITDSIHRTSEGTVAYVRCASCGAHRVDLLQTESVHPAALSLPTRATRR
ncbi:hypothetical protein FJ657_15200 [Schumannella soli]|uniref:Uncharacterized protein n=1 Tax=Schumannella soli TaxID=2590779 RepID=A0A506XXH0_9MICO|nr:hypothetical protein FJ657_15200 [Schumannella soli]